MSQRGARNTKDRPRQAGGFRRAVEQSEDNKGRIRFHGRHCQDKTQKAYLLSEGARCADQLFCLGGRKRGSEEEGDVCVSEEESLVGGVIQQQESVSQGFRVSKWADIKESFGCSSSEAGEKVCRQ